jgi:hypothetical protein
MLSAPGPAQTTNQLSYCLSTWDYRNETPHQTPKIAQPYLLHVLIPWRILFEKKRKRSFPWLKKIKYLIMLP